MKGTTIFNEEKEIIRVGIKCLQRDEIGSAHLHSVWYSEMCDKMCTQPSKYSHAQEKRAKVEASLAIKVINGCEPGQTSAIFAENMTKNIPISIFHITYHDDGAYSLPNVNQKCN